MWGAHGAPGRRTRRLVRARRGRRRAGLAIAGAGALYTFLALFVIVPSFADSDSPYFGFYERVGGSAGGVLRTAVTDPLVILSELFAGNVILFAIALAAPLAGLFVLGPLSVAALPTLAVTRSPTVPGHSIPGSTTWPRSSRSWSPAPCSASRGYDRRTGPLAAMVVVVSRGCGRCSAPWDGAPAASSLWYQSDISARHVAALDRAVALVPADAPVSTSNRVGGHLAARGYLYMFPLSGTRSGSSSTPTTCGCRTRSFRFWPSGRLPTSRASRSRWKPIRAGRSSWKRTASTSSASAQPDDSPGRTITVISSSR